MKAVNLFALWSILDLASQWSDSSGRAQGRHVRYESLMQSLSRPSELSQTSSSGNEEQIDIDHANLV